MGKVKEGSSVSTPAKASKGKSGGSVQAPLRRFPGQSAPLRSLQADAGVVRQGLHRDRAGAGRRRRGLADFRVGTRLLAGLAVRTADRLRRSFWDGWFSGSFIFRPLPSF